MDCCSPKSTAEPEGASVASRWRRFLPPLLLVLLPLLVNAVALTDYLSANPIHWESGLNAVRPNTHLLIRGVPGWVDGNAGVTTQALGHLAAEQWLHGQVPWWNEFSGIGLPLAAEMQNSALFLPFILLLHFGNGLIYLKTVLQIVAGLGLYAFARQLGLGRRASLLGAILFQFNGTFAWFSHGPIMPVPFLPWLLFGIERATALARQARPGGWGWIAAALAFSIVAGFPETAYLDGWLGLAFAACRIATFGAGRTRLALKILAGGTVGLLLSAPAAMPFLQFASRAYVGPHGDFSSGRLLAESYAQLLFPYIYGPIRYGNEMFGESADIWWHTDGYCGLVPVFLAMLALARRSAGDRGLRYLLAAWLALTLAKAGGLHPVSRLLDLVPFVRETMFFNYITPSWQTCLAVLAAFAVDDWHAGPWPSRRLRLAPALAALACILLAGASLFAARNEIQTLARAIPGFALFPLATIGLTAASLLAAATLLSGNATRRRSLALGGIAGLASIALYGVPLLSGTRDRALNLQPIAFLRQHLGLSRFYAAPAPEPNYGAYFQVAQINHNYLPVPQNWTDFLQSRIDPDLDPVEFHGTGLTAAKGEPPSGPGAPPAIPAAARLRAYENLAVRYLVLPAGAEPFGDWKPPDIVPSDGIPFPLQDGQGFAAALPPSQVAAGSIREVGLQIGTYRGHPPGVLTIELCSASRCSRGQTATIGARDNAVARLRLDPPLPAGQGEALRAHVSYRGNARVAVWLWPPANPAGIAGPDPARPLHIPFLSLYTLADGATPPLVYRDRQFDIRELPHPAAYFSSALGTCRLRPVSRTETVADCAAADTLLRRELAFPGWRAVADGKSLPVAARDGLIQAVALSPGRHDLKFRYQPPGIAIAYAAFAAGLLALAAQMPIAAALERRRDGSSRPQ